MLLRWVGRSAYKLQYNDFFDSKFAFFYLLLRTLIKQQIMVYPQKNRRYM